MLTNSWSRSRSRSGHCSLGGGTQASSYGTMVCWVASAETLTSNQGAKRSKLFIGGVSSTASGTHMVVANGFQTRFN